MIENSSSSVLELQSEHGDGRTLTAILQPGTQIALGALDATVERIVGYLEGEPVLTVEDSEIRECLAEARDECLGWRLEDEGIAQLTPASSEP